MKRIVSFLLALMLIIAVMPTAALAAGAQTVYVSRNGGRIFLHSGPGYDYDAGNTVSHNAKVTVKDTADDWSKITVNATGKTGWIRTMYIDGTTAALGDGYKAITGTTKVYSSWKANASVKATVAKGDTVLVNETEHDFAKVIVTGSKVTGWVPIRFIGKTVKLDLQQPASESSAAYRTTASVLNLRKGPGTDYAVTGKLPYGTGCNILESSGNWRRIKTFSGQTGWVSANYLTRQTIATVSTNTKGLNIRTRPSTASNSYVLGSLPRGTKVTVEYTSGNWAYISYGKLKGWMSLSWLKF